MLTWSVRASSHAVPALWLCSSSGTSTRQPFGQLVAWDNCLPCAGWAAHCWPNNASAIAVPSCSPVCVYMCVFVGGCVCVCFNLTRTPCPCICVWAAALASVDCAAIPGAAVAPPCCNQCQAIVWPVPAPSRSASVARISARSCVFNMMQQIVWIIEITLWLQSWDSRNFTVFSRGSFSTLWARSTLFLFGFVM